MMISLGGYLRSILWCRLVTAVLNQRYNVLFLVADDMRPQLGAYQGSDFPSRVHQKMHTPHLDSLASRSLLLRKAYVQVS